MTETQQTTASPQVIRVSRSLSPDGWLRRRRQLEPPRLKQRPGRGRRSWGGFHFGSPVVRPRKIFPPAGKFRSLPGPLRGRQSPPRPSKPQLGPPPAAGASLAVRRHKWTASRSPRPSAILRATAALALHRDRQSWKLTPLRVEDASNDVGPFLRQVTEIFHRRARASGSLCVVRGSPLMLAPPVDGVAGISGVGARLLGRQAVEQALHGRSRGRFRWQGWNAIGRSVYRVPPRHRQPPAAPDRIRPRRIRGETIADANAREARLSRRSAQI